MPKDAENAHRNAAIYGDLNETICWKIKRQVRNDWTIRYNNEYYQLREPDDKNIIKPGQFITLKKYLNGEIRFWADNIHIKHGALSRKPQAPSKTKKYYIPKEPAGLAQRNHILKKNSQNSPWRQSNSALYNRKAFTTTQQKSSS